MAVQSKPKTTRKVESKKKQEEGKTRATGELSDHRVQVAPDSKLDRGIGSSFAYAVGAILQAAPDLKGSESDFLGVPSQVIDPKQYVQNLSKNK